MTILLQKGAEKNEIGGVQKARNYFQSFQFPSYFSMQFHFSGFQFSNGTFFSCTSCFITAYYFFSSVFDIATSYNERVHASAGRRKTFL
jgi:hypothetical protein